MKSSENKELTLKELEVAISNLSTNESNILLNLEASKSNNQLNDTTSESIPLSTQMSKSNVQLNKETSESSPLNLQACKSDKNVQKIELKNRYTNNVMRNVNRINAIKHNQMTNNKIYTNEYDPNRNLLKIIQNKVLPKCLYNSKNLTNQQANDNNQKLMYVRDEKTKDIMLIDIGAQVTICSKGKNVGHGYVPFNLVTTDEQPMKTYGYIKKQFVVDGMEYAYNFIQTDVPQPILGVDFLRLNK